MEIKMEEKTWEELPLKLLDEIKKTLNDLKFKYMTPVQAACIPALLGHKDVAAEAVTGSGKTLAFLVPVLQILMKRQPKLKKFEIGALIILPTRELAHQVFEVLQHFLKNIESLSSALFVGGKNVNADVLNYSSKGANILLCTPGRLGDLLSRKVDNRPSISAGLKALEVLILDEADRLLDLGFTATINTILAYLPKLRRTGIFSATQTEDVINLIRAGMRNPVQVKVTEKGSSKLKTPASLKNFYMIVEGDSKFKTFVSLLKEKSNDKLMVFFSTGACVEYFYEVLKRILPKKINLLSLHGKMNQKRIKIFEEFRQLTSGILLCTDVMCRGVDIPLVEWVMQFDPPTSAVSFVHRCGRTARNGEPGSALLILLPNEQDYVPFVELNQKVKLKEIEPPEQSEEVFEKMRNFQIRDRALYDKANRAYVSHIQAYTKHECNLIINIKNLDFDKLAHCFGLLKLPKMPELKKKKCQYLPYDIDFNTIPYLDRAVEKKRLSNLASYRKTGQWPGAKVKKGQKTESWSSKRKAKEEKKVRKEVKKETIDKNKFTDDDLKDLDDDFKVIKKFKKGKMSEDDFSNYFGCGELLE